MACLFPAPASRLLPELLFGYDCYVRVPVHREHSASEGVLDDTLNKHRYLEENTDMRCLCPNNNCQEKHSFNFTGTHVSK